MELIGSFFSGSRWVWVTILVIGALADRRARAGVVRASGA